MRIEGNTFIVAGGGSGLGAAVARRLVAEGGRVVIADIAASGAALAETLGPRACFHRTDVTDEAAAAGAVALAGAQPGPLRGLINCAGICPAEKVVGRDGPHRLDSFARVVGINLIGSFNMMRLAAAAIAEQPAEADGERGVIVNTASIAASDGQIGQTAYAASKAGVIGLTLPAARELARFGIRVMSVAPGIFATPMVEAMPEAVQQSLAAQPPFPRRLGQPDEFAELCHAIIVNPMLNGTTIRLDGAVRMGGT
ncbi:SDR family NAD(P)-dependent oxidoreductase [Phaeospirillum tilakii]|uniref:SDR family NAD(P)-dependent oxidoreductase n=1 Tax=Phaeospirillum tilakii TaxID=741673 RepID=A0ABW5CFW1_9PROT